MTGVPDGGQGAVQGCPGIRKRASKARNRDLGGPRSLKIGNKEKELFCLHRPGGMSPTCNFIHKQFSCQAHLYFLNTPDSMTACGSRAARKGFRKLTELRMSVPVTTYWITLSKMLGI
jgi:hypothetical protein